MQRFVTPHMKAVWQINTRVTTTQQQPLPPVDALQGLGCVSGGQSGVQGPLRDAQ